MFSDNKEFKSEIEKLRVTLNKISLTLLKDRKNVTSCLIDISKEMDKLINEYILLIKK